jgi:DNA-binding IclR family transcriptional regulator
MVYTYEQLSKMTVAELRTIAEGIEHEAVHGFSTMHKEKLLPALCLALGIEAHAHHVAVGINKTAVKAEIRKLKVERDVAIQSHDRARLLEARHKIHELKRKLRKAIV